MQIFLPNFKCVRYPVKLPARKLLVIYHVWLRYANFIYLCTIEKYNLFILQSHFPGNISLSPSLSLCLFPFLYLPPPFSVSLLHFTLSTILNFKFAVGISTLTQLVLLIFDFILHFFFVPCCKNISNASHFVDHSNQTQALRLMLLQCTEVQWGRCRAGQGRAGQGYVVGFVVDSAAKQIKTFARKMPLNELQHYCCLLLLSPLLLLWLSKCS